MGHLIDTLFFLFNGCSSSRSDMYNALLAFFLASANVSKNKTNTYDNKITYKCKKYK